LFLALWRGDTELDAVAKVQQSLPWPATARLTARENIHVTLHFIGQMPRGRLQELIGGISVRAPPVELTFERLELWSRGLVVLTASHRPAALLELHAALGERLVRLGLPVDARPYLPHITLARSAGASASFLMRARAPSEVTWRAVGHVLVESTGGRYHVLARY
jgi:RNA 2',3'-cyclic 3'-phosphodiesterase